MNLQIHVYVSTQSSTCTDVSSKPKRGRPRKLIDVHLKRLDKVAKIKDEVLKKATKTIRNNEASGKDRHDKSDKQKLAAIQLNVLESENEELTAKHQKLVRDIAMLQHMLLSL